MAAIQHHKQGRVTRKDKFAGLCRDLLQCIGQCTAANSSWPCLPLVRQQWKPRCKCAGLFSSTECYRVFGFVQIGLSGQWTCSSQKIDCAWAPVTQPEWTWVHLPIFAAEIADQLALAINSAGRIWHDTISMWPFPVGTPPVEHCFPSACMRTARLVHVPEHKNIHHAI